MKIIKQRFTCGDCSAVFEAEIVMEAPVSVCVASMETIRCAKCGGKKLFFGGEMSPDDDKLADKKTEQERSDWWAANGEIGNSSSTIYAVFNHGIRGKLRVAVTIPDIPYDPDDFQRCHRLLEILPEWRANLSKVSGIYTIWEPFVREWSTMEALYAEEKPTGRAPKLWKLMKELVEESSKIGK